MPPRVVFFCSLLLSACAMHASALKGIVLANEEGGSAVSKVKVSAGGANLTETGQHLRVPIRSLAGTDPSRSLDLVACRGAWAHAPRRGIWSESGPVGWRRHFASSHESGESSAARFARVHRPATFSRILPPRRRCCTASWICSRGYTPATGTTRAPSATSGAASRMTGTTLSR